MNAQVSTSGFEDMARAAVADFAPDADLDILGVTFDLIRLSNQLVSDLETRVHRPLGWSWAGFRIMFTVLVAGPVESSRIARIAGVSRASISAVLNTLERDGLVRRLRESADRRVVTIELTDRGRAAVIEGYRRQHEVEKAWIAALPEAQRPRLNAMLRLLLQKSPVADHAREAATAVS